MGPMPKAKVFGSWMRWGWSESRSRFIFESTLAVVVVVVDDDGGGDEDGLELNDQEEDEDDTSRDLSE